MGAQHFHELTYRGQVRRLRRMAEIASQSWDLEEPRLSFLAHHENATFRCQAARDECVDGYVPGRYNLRLHREGYQQLEHILSELEWLRALRADTDLLVPEPVATKTGEYHVEVEIPDTPKRVCTLLRWLPGRIYGYDTVPETFMTQLGRTMATLHDHALRWKPSNGFTRRVTTLESQFAIDDGLAIEPRVWDDLPGEDAALIREIYEAITEQRKSLSDSSESRMVIHCDLYPGNMTQWRGEALAFDFDDCGWGHLLDDFAVPIEDRVHQAEMPRVLDSVLEGYVEVRPFPEELIPYVPSFVIARLITVNLWAIDRARVHPPFRKHIPRWLETIRKRGEEYLKRP